MEDRSSLGVLDALLEELYWGHRLDAAVARVGVGVYARDMLAYAALSPALLQTLQALALRNESIPVPDYDQGQGLIAEVSGDPDFFWELDVEDWFATELSEESLLEEIERVGQGGELDQDLADDLLEFCGSNAVESWANVVVEPWWERSQLGEARPEDPLEGFIWDIRWGRLLAIEEGLDSWPWFRMDLDVNDLRLWLRVRRPVLEWRLARGETPSDDDVPQAGDLLDLPGPLRSQFLNAEGALRLLQALVLPGAADDLDEDEEEEDEEDEEEEDEEDEEEEDEEEEGEGEEDEEDDEEEGDEEVEDEEDEDEDGDEEVEDEEDEAEDDLDDEDEENDMPKPPPVPMRSDVPLPAVAWSWRRWEGAKKERPNPTKEALLRRSLDMVRGKKGNEEAVREIVSKSIEAGLFQLAMEAIEGFGPDAAFDMYVSINNLFEDVGTWPLLDDAFVQLCERRVLDGKTARSGMGWGDHFAEQRSCALGVLGRYRLITGKPDAAVRLWAAGEDIVDVDEAIAETCDLIAQHAGSHLDYAISLTDLIRTETIRAKTLASLSEYA